MELAGTVAFITGGASGIGKATAALLAEAGARVAIFDRAEERAERTVEQISAAGGAALAIDGDVAVPDDVERAIQATLARWGRLDIVFANAGINGVWAPLEEIAPEEWDRTQAVNLKGTFLTAKYALPALKVRGGSLIITSSVNGTRIFSNTGATAYACAKAAQVAFGKMLAVELGRDNIRVNVICPGAIHTHIGESTITRDLDGAGIPVVYPAGPTPLPAGAGWPREVAQLVRFLASDASRHITGTTIFIDGGESLVQG
ncbi:MAG TPA: SDR family NAD(P)-dependent oxidoreductase [Armatimonadota bacterium]|nr:SDR family NAD(P)-dependent oxidoreductase [Armatimonadota bacterium]